MNSDPLGSGKMLETFMGEIAGWVAPIATMIAAVMTAANLGSRITGWGFVVFSIGSVAWVAVALSSDQGNLLLSNCFLTLVNLIGIWRWLGRRATYDAGARRAAEESAEDDAPSLFQLGGMEGRAVADPNGAVLGHVVDAMAECASGRISYIVVREGSELAVKDRLHAIPWSRLIVDEDNIQLPSGNLADLPTFKPDQWPDRRPEA